MFSAGRQLVFTCGQAKLFYVNVFVKELSFVLKQLGKIVLTSKLLGSWLLVKALQQSHTFISVERFALNLTS